MGRRTQLFQKIPWTGGVNSSVDPGVLHPNDLVQADNVVFASSGSRIKREGFSYFDTAIPSVLSRSSTGTARTLVFASSINISLPKDEILVEGEKIAVSGTSNAEYATTEGTISSISTTNVTNDTITYTFSGADSYEESTTADTDATVTRAYDIIGVHDLWFYSTANNIKEQQTISVTSQGLIFRYDENGRRTQITASEDGLETATALVTSSVSMCDTRTYNNKLIVTFSGLGNTPKVYDPNGEATWADLPGAPDGQFMQEHLGRLWMDDKTSLDKLHYCTTFNETEWQGTGDSGDLDISIGDGDPVGISAILPPFKGRLIVAKGTKVFQVLGTTPETFQIDAITSGLGVESHRGAVAVELDDVYYFSSRGAHSIVTTDQFGDFAGQFLSSRVQLTFNLWNKGRLKYTQGVYMPTLNSVVWTVAEGGRSKASSLWLFNPTIANEDGTKGVWYRWPNLNAQSITTRLDDDGPHLLCGDDEGRLFTGQNGTFTDFEDQPIPFRVKTGTIYVDGNPQTIKAFKKLSLLFRPRGRYNFTVYFKVDNFPPQAVVFSQNATGDTLGNSFLLGSSILGSNSALAPFTKDVVGHGRGCTLEVFQTGLGAQVEIYGFIIEYESADIADEVIQEV